LVSAEDGKKKGDAGRGGEWRGKKVIKSGINEVLD
jgi:hypothetical protein